MPLKNDIFLRSLLKEKVPYTPIWLMRQAGRYLPEYRATRAKAGSFMDLAMNPHYACEVTLQPVDRYPLDAAILFSDILTIPDAMGLGLSFLPGEGPKFAKPVQDEAAVKELFVPDPADKLKYVTDAVVEIKRALNDRIPLIGFSGSPFTLACYMIEGGSSLNFRKVKEMLYRRPDLLKQILDVNTAAVTSYLNAQIEAGANAVMIFDTWGGALAHSDYLEYSLKCISQVVSGLIKERDGKRIPSIVFTKGSAPWLTDIAACGADAMGVDWTVSLGDVRRQIGDSVCLQGNMDPSILFAGPDEVRTQARKVIEDFGMVGQGGHVFNLGHGIDKDTDPDTFAALVDEVHEYSRRFHD